jgi:hypothetical protein
VAGQRVKVLVDAAGRVSLSRVRNRSFDLYEAEELSDGTVILRPLLALPEAELTARTRPEVQRATAKDAQVSTIVSGSQEVF